MLLKVLTGKLTFESLTPCDLSKCTKNEILEYFENTYSLNESIFVGLKDKSAMYRCPDRLRLPLIFYYGHTASVYMNKMILAGLVEPEERIDLKIETLCETGVDEMSWDDTENYRMGGRFQWPELSRIVDYRSKVKDLILRVIDRTPLQLPVTMDSPWWGLFMGMEHERIHIETSSVLIRQLPVSMVTLPEGWKTAPLSSGKGAGDNRMIKMEKSTVTMGKLRDFPSYGWDNEYGSVTANVGEFEASQFLCTNREWLAFVEAGGYENQSLWSEEGWNWVQYKKAKHPLFWVCDQGCKSGCGADLSSYSHCKAQEHDTPPHCNGHSVVDSNGHQGQDEGGGLSKNGDHVVVYQYRLRCMFHEIDMAWDWPVEVNYLEAKAFCSWKGPGYRLPCEAEHHVMRGDMSSPDDGTSCDIIFNKNPEVNFNLKYGSSAPVNMHKPTSAGFYDVFGNTWEWVEDHFNGFPDFQTHALYDDFSTPTFDGKHNVILGGSWISTGDEASRFARYAFRRHFFQHCGFRLARSVVSESVEKKVTKLPVRLIDQPVYVLNHGTEDITIMLDKNYYAYDTFETTNTQYLYETDHVMNEMLRLEYTQDSTLTEAIVNRVEDALARYDVNKEKALHMGCATGAVSFKIAVNFDHLLAQDFCARFINVCQKLQNNNSVTCTQLEAMKRQKRSIHFPEGGSRDNILFKQLTWLSNEIGFYDFVLSTGLDRSQSPKAWLLRMNEIVKPNGLMLVVSAQVWKEDTLTPLLNRFTLLEGADFVFTQFGKAQLVHMTIWRKTTPSEERPREA